MERRKVSLRGILVVLVLMIAVCPLAAQDRDPIDGQATFYYPGDNNPPGAPPNYNLVDSTYFYGVPDLPDPLTNNVGGYYIWNDTAAGKWNIANFNFTRGESSSQFHGSILVLMEQDPAPYVNFWAQGFELYPDLMQNDRWGWIKWPDSIYPNLYEIWWDYTVDYSKPNNIGDYRDTMAVVVAGCAVDFNIWSAGVASGATFDAENIFLGAAKTQLSLVPGFVDTYVGITDQYQAGNDVNEPNLTRFTAKSLPGATYNANGLVLPGTTYGDRYAGSWAYEGNGVQFSTLFCPPTSPPNFVTPSSPDTVTLNLCTSETIYDTLEASDPDPNDSLWLTLLSGPGVLNSTPGTTPVFGYYQFTPTATGVYTAVFEVMDLNGDADTVSIVYDITINTAPVVQLPGDSSIFACGPIDICLPLDITDADCDIISVTTNLGQYAGNQSDFDQVGRLFELGATVYQIGGGDPGKLLLDASEFVPPVNSQSGVDVTLPNFDFAGFVVDYGSFPNGLQPSNSADHLLGSPTDMTFTAPGPGGPDGGDGDGSVAFASGYNCILGFYSTITTCNGSNTDFAIFTNTDGGGTAQFDFRLNGTVTYTTTQVLPSGASGSGDGGVTLDLPDGIVFNEVKIRCLSGIVEIDAVAARTAASSSLTDICFPADTSGVYEVIATATDACGNVTSDYMFVTVALNTAPVADAGSDVSVFQCAPTEICLDVAFSDIDNNIVLTEKVSGPGTMTGDQICFTPATAGTYSFVIHAVDECGLEDFDTVNVTVGGNNPPIADDPDTLEYFLCATESLCYTFTASDADGGSLTWSHLAGVGSITPGGEFCFTPALSGMYGAAVVVSDSCGAADTVSIHFTIGLNSAPVAADPGAAVDLFLCASQGVCYTFGASDVNGGALTWTALSGDGTLSSGGEWCFTPTASGTFTMTAVVADSCGAADTVSHTYNVTLNDAPTVAFGADTSLFLCAPQSICLAYTVADPQGLAGLTETMPAGYGVLDTLANEICFTPTADGSYQFIIEVTDDCNETAADTITVTVDLNTAPVAEAASSVTLAQCDATEICYTFGATDGDSDPLTWSLLSGGGTMSAAGEYCFTPTGSGSYTATVVATDPCGAADTTSRTWVTTVNATPVAVDPGGPFDVFMCVAEQYCFTFAATDANSEPLTWTKLTGDGAVDAAGQWCFTPSGSGAYAVQAEVSDACGAADTVSLTVNVAINDAPTVVLANDTSVFLCDPTELCFDYTVSDPQGAAGLVEDMVSGFGTIDTGADKICFTPTSAGTYDFIVCVTDSCGASACDTLTVTVTFGPSATIACPPGNLSVSLCSADNVCQALGITPATATVTTSLGTFAAGELCFYADTSGQYTVTVIAEEACGADTCEVVFDVEIGQAAQITCPDPDSVFICAPETVCVPVGVMGPGAVVTVSPIGTFNAGTLCFDADTSGHYEIQVAAETACGADTCLIVTDVTINAVPVATDPGLPVDTFICAAGQFCYQFDGYDADGEALVWMKLSGSGTVSATGLWCFNASATGAYTVTAQVTDACGAADTVTHTYNVTKNTPPAVAFGADTTVGFCGPTNVCLPYSASDIDGNLAAVTVVSGPGTIDNGNSQVCFVAGASGSYQIVVQATDACGATDRDTINVTVDLNGTPVAVDPSPVTDALCTAEEMCYTFTAADPDTDPLTWTLLSGPGAITVGGEYCFTPTGSGVYTATVAVADPCGAADTTSITYTLSVNTGPVAVDPASPVDTFRCAAGQVCFQFEASDADADALTWTRLSGNGSLTDAGNWCFNANASGSYTITAAVADPCGAADTVSLTYNITLNTVPVLTLGNDTTLFQCSAGTVCWPYSFSDVDGNGASVSIFSGHPSGYVDEVDSRLCFTPTGAGVYTFVVQGSDACAATATDTIVFTIELNNPPVVDAGEDQIVFACSITPVCVPVAFDDPDGNLATTEMVSGPGAFDGSQVCFTPGGTDDYLFVFKATDLCGAEAYDSVTVFYTVNSAPTAYAGEDRTIALCSPQEVCWEALCADVDGNLADSSLTGPGYFDGISICFTPTTSDAYTFILTATDECGLTAVDTVTVNVTINAPPVCVVPNDTIIFQCLAEEVCLPAYGSDADGNLKACQIVSGPGALVGGEWCYTPVADQAVTVVMQCEDSCGAVCQSQFTVDFRVNEAPQIAFGADFDAFLCAFEQICLPYTVSDPEGLSTTTVSLISGAGTLDEVNSQVCFTPTAEGPHAFIIQVTDNCGLIDADTLTVDVTLNSAPTANAGLDQTLTLCGSQEICWAVECDDAEGNLTDCIFTGPGLYDGISICFTPTTSDVYTFVLEAIDECGLSMADTVQILVTLNSAPQVTLPSDISEFLCTPTEICFDYTVADINGGAVTEVMESGYGSVDTAANQICFTPTTAGEYEFVVRATDECGAAGSDTIVVTVTFGETPVIACPTAPVDVSLCAAEDVCYQLGIAPAGATVTTSLGTYSGGELCFYADTSGVYTVTVIAEASCGADTCLLTFNVDIGSAAQIVCPEPQDLFICEADTVCVPVTVLKRNESVTVSPIGYYSGGNVCFFADTSGHYELTIIASTECGADTCLLVADVAINAAPVADEPTSPIDTFICAATEFCHDFTATDADLDALIWSRLSGPGSINAAGQWCFTASAGGTYTVVVVVTDPCGAADTVSLTYHVTLNSKPVIAFTGGYKSRLTTFMCDTVPICLDYTVTDADDNVDLEELLVGPGTIDTLSNQVCFTPDSAGVYRFIVRATDACGEFDNDTLDVTVMLNTGPMADAGDDQTVFACTPTQICWAAHCTDIDDNIDSCFVVGVEGVYSNSQICFTPDTAGVYTIILGVVDYCYAVAYDTVLVTVELNSPPVCIVPADTSFFQCSAGQVSLPVSADDPDGNFHRCELVTGPGSISGGNWVFTPTIDQTVTVHVMCSDSCGAVCTDSFTVAFDVNSPPTVDLGPDTARFLCEPQQLCLPAAVADEDGNLVDTQVIAPAGATLDGGNVCYNVPAGDAAYEFIVEATDACGAVARDTTTVAVTFNHAPVLSLPPSFAVYLDIAGEVCFAVGAEDVDGNLTNVSVSSIGSYAAGEVCFQADSSGIYCFELIARDGCQVETVDSICVTVQLDECVHVAIEKTHGAYQGQHEQVDVILQSSGKEIGGYDFLIQYDPSALLFSLATPGDLITGCGWEYFTYRYGADGNCSGCPTGLLRVVAIAETNNGANHPGCFLDGQVGVLASLDFLVSNDRTLECQYVPIRFYWIDCGDNGVSSRLGDTLFISRRVFDFELAELTNTTYGMPGYFGATDDCLIPDSPDKPASVRCIDFTNGGIDIVCADSIDARADINLNGVAYEIADAVLYSNYFVYGIGVFNHVEGQTAASDVNADGIPLTVADLVYLIRVVIGDTPPMPKLDPNMTTEVQFAVSERWLEIEKTDYRVGALYVVLEGETVPQLHHDAGSMEMLYNFDGADTRVLIYNLNGKAYLQAGRVLELDGSHAIKSVDVAAYDGFVMTARLETLPDQFELYQNYPNPFNPMTTIEFALPTQVEWNMTVYNVLGQTVERFEGIDDAGYVKIEWDAGRFASGVYFYRLRAGEYSATKKMVLVK